MGNLADSWRACNEKLQYLADCIANSPVNPAQIALGHLAALSEQLTRTQALLAETRSLGETEVGLDQHLVEYRDCLKRLLDRVPALQAQLLAERTRLEPEQAHLQAAAAWARCTKTLLT